MTGDLPAIVRLALDGWPLLVLLAQAGLVLASYWLARRFVQRREYEDRAGRVDARLDDHEARLGEVEGDLSGIGSALEQLPRREDLLKIELGVEELRGGLREVAARQEGTNALIGNVEKTTATINKALLARGQ